MRRTAMMMMAAVMVVAMGCAQSTETEPVQLTKEDQTTGTNPVVTILLDFDNGLARPDGSAVMSLAEVGDVDALVKVLKTPTSQPALDSTAPVTVTVESPAGQPPLKFTSRLRDYTQVNNVWIDTANSGATEAEQAQAIEQRAETAATQEVTADVAIDIQVQLQHTVNVLLKVAQNMADSAADLAKVLEALKQQVSESAVEASPQG